MNITGLDLSLTATGIACAEHVDVLKPPKGVVGMERLDWLRRQVRNHLGPGYSIPVPPTLVVIEGYTYATTHSAHVLGELGGVIRHMLWTTGVAYVDVAPAAVKKFATGKGNTNKDAMLAAAIRAGYQGDSNDGADAWWLRQMGLYATCPHDEPIVLTTAYRNEAVAKVAWPEVGAYERGGAACPRPSDEAKRSDAYKALSGDPDAQARMEQR